MLALGGFAFTAWTMMFEHGWLRTRKSPAECARWKIAFTCVEDTT
jgi:hypothetical protein